MRRLHRTLHVSSRAPNTRELIIDIFEKVSLSPYIFLYQFAAILALVRTRNRHLVPYFWQWLQTFHANVISSLKTLNKLPSTRLSVQLKNGRLEVLELVALFLLKTETYDAKKTLESFS